MKIEDTHGDFEGFKREDRGGMTGQGEEEEEKE